MNDDVIEVVKSFDCFGNSFIEDDKSRDGAKMEKRLFTFPAVTKFCDFWGVIVALKLDLHEKS